jgi:hypothetical protein
LHFVYQALDQKVGDHDLDFIVDKLAYSNKSSKPLYDIKQDGWQKDIYNEICADSGGNVELAKSKSTKVQLIQFIDFGRFRVGSELRA